MSPINAIEKMGGGFSKALLMRKKNGTEVIAKIPFPNAGPSVYTTESEVAVLRFVKQHTSIPVPDVLTWSSDNSNPVGAEYIIMEKAAGVPLFQQWGNMTESDKLELIKSLTMFECQLSSLQFPAHGSLYLRSSFTDLSVYQLLDSGVDSSNSYCVGRSSDRSYTPETCPEYRNSEFDLGPWSSISAFVTAIAMRETFRILHNPQQYTGTFYHGTPVEQTNLLQNAMCLMKVLDSHPTLAQCARPVLWHTDLHMGNIYVSPDEPSRIVSIIDWQSTSVSPAFLQVWWPVFLRPPKNYTKGLVKLKLPENFDQMDSDDKELAKYEMKQATMAKAYEVSTYLEDRAAHNAMNMPRVFRELFTRCGETSELGFTGECPYSFTPEEIQEHDSQFGEYEDWHSVQRLARECLDTDAEGWISPEMDITGKRRQNEELRRMFIERMAKEKSAEEARKMWPFT